SVDRGGSTYASITVGNLGEFRLYWGTDTQSADTFALSGFPNAHPAYKGVCYIVGKRIRFGKNRDTPGNLELVLERKPDGVPSGISNTLSSSGANALASCYEILANERFGMAAEGLIDAEQWET